MENKENIKNILESFDKLKSARSKFDSAREDIYKYVCPQTSITDTNKIVCSSPISARMQLANSLQSMLVSKGGNWFNLGFTQYKQENITDEMQYWLKQTEFSLSAILNNPDTNFFCSLHEFFLNLTAHGTAVLYIEEAENLAAPLYFKNIPIEECYFEDNRYGSVDTIYRLFKLTVKAACDIFFDNKKLKKAKEKDPDEKIELLHCVVRESENNKKYKSLYILKDQEEILKEGIYDYFPFLVCRFIKHQGESYGYSPAHSVMSDIKLLNEYRTLGIKIKQKQVNPALLVPRTGYFTPFNTSPGKINYYESGVADKVLPMSNLENIESTLSEQAQCQEAIRSAFFIDLLRMGKENKEMTATEARARSSQQMQMLSPIVHRIEAELLNPLIKTTYKILVKYDLIENANITQKPDIDVYYLSPFARSSKYQNLENIERFFVFSAQIGQINPSIYDNINFDELLRIYGKYQSVDMEIFKPAGEVDRQRRLQDQQAKAAREAEQMMEMAKMQNEN